MEEKENIPTRGIMMIATGHHFYGKMALNNAVAIKHNEPQMSISIVTDEKALKDVPKDLQAKYFNNIIPIGEITWASAKTQLTKLSPYDETIYMDSDTIWIKGRKPSDLFNELKEVEFAMITEGVMDVKTKASNANKKYRFGAEPRDIIQAYSGRGKLSEGKLYMVRSEMFYFKKTKPVKELFKEANKIWKLPLCKTHKLGHETYDEFAFTVACATTGVYPHKEVFNPVYWHYLYGGNPTQGELSKNYYAFSIGGNVNDQFVKKTYNHMVEYYFNQEKISCSPYLHVNKREYLSERRHN